LFFASTDGLRLPRIQTYIAEKILFNLIFYSSFFSYKNFRTMNVEINNGR